MLFGKKYMIPKALYYITSLFISISITIDPIMTYGKMTFLCCFPLTQYLVFGNLVIKALNMGTILSFNNFFEPMLVDFSMATVFFYTILMTLFMLLIFIYLIPLSIAVDEENPLKWYYPCVCGCFRKRTIPMNFVEDENDNEAE